MVPKNVKIALRDNLNISNVKPLLRTKHPAYIAIYMCSYVIIESNKASVSKIKKVFDEFSNFKCLGDFPNISMAQETIYKDFPKLIFLDLDNTEAPFNFVNELKQYIDEHPDFIGLSSSTDMAFKAIKNNFFDYLLKPLTDLDIRKAALRFKKKCSSKSPAKKNLCLKSYKDYHYIDTDEILFLKADNNTTDFHMSDGSTIIAYKTLKTFEDILPPNFLRIHKSYIVNMDFVTRVNYGKNNCSLKQFDNKIPFTKTYSSNIDTMMKSLSNTSLVSLN